MDKADIRKEILKLRDAQAPFEITEKSRTIFDKLVNLDEYKEAENLLIYASMRSEVRTDEIILDAIADGKKVYCPKVTDKKHGKMVFVRIFALEDLVEGYFGIREPDLNEQSETFSYDEYPELSDEITLAIVPGVAFDRNNYRIGYNGGFYIVDTGVDFEELNARKLVDIYDFHLIMFILVRFNLEYFIKISNSLYRNFILYV